MTEAEVLARLDPGRLIEAIETAFRDRYPSAIIPPRTVVPVGDDVFLSMTCADPAADLLGLKLVVVRGNPPAGEDRVEATYLLLDPRTGRPRLQLPARTLTDLRTAATSAVATRHLAAAGAETLGLFGTGRLATAHLRVLLLVRSFPRVLVCGRTPAQSERFVQASAGRSPCRLIAADARTCAAEADVLCTCTTATSPLFDGRWLRPGTHLNLAGAFQPHTREVDTATIARAAVVVETRAGVLSEAGDLMIPAAEGRPPAVVADLHELTRHGRQASLPGDITVFKSVGCALEDLVAAELLGSG